MSVSEHGTVQWILRLSILQGSRRDCPDERERPYSCVSLNKDSVIGNHELRTHDSFTRNGEEAEHIKANGRAQTVRGVKGLSWFSYLLNFNVIREVGIDYMHPPWCCKNAVDIVVR